MSASAFPFQQYVPAPVRHWLRIFAAAGRNWSRSHAFSYAGALAFFTLFSLAPVMIIAVTIVGWVLGARVARERIAARIEETVGAEATGAIFRAVEQAQLDKADLIPAIVGVVAMLIGATTVFAQMQAALNIIWEVAPRPSRSSLWIFIKRRLLSLAVVLAIGFVLLVSLLINVALRSIMAFADHWLPVPETVMVALEIVFSITVITVLFAAMLRILPDVMLSWRDVLVGALLSAILFTVGSSLIVTYLALAAPASVYGAAGSLVLVLLWVYYSSLILLFGAALTRARLEARGGERVPRSTAVCMHTELLEDSAGEDTRTEADG